jgi:hypothetical protein
VVNDNNELVGFQEFEYICNFKNNRNKSMAKKIIEQQHQCKVYYQDLYGRKQAKYDYLWNNSIKTIDWKELKPEKEKYYFIIKDNDSILDYEKGLKIDDIFSVYTSGIKTHNDNDLVSFKTFEENNHIYYYRPFDIRNINYDQKMLFGIDLIKWNTCYIII